MFEVGDICSWYPGESDYPSIVVLLFKPEPDKPTWRVTYANPEDAEFSWVVDESELVKRDV
jgi:hypothetical protein